MIFGPVMIAMLVILVTAVSVPSTAPSDASNAAKEFALKLGAKDPLRASLVGWANGEFSSGSLGDLGDRRAIPFLRMWLNEHATERTHQYYTTRWVLAKLGEPAAKEELYADLRSRDLKVVRQATWDVAQFVSPDSVQALLPLLSDPMAYADVPGELTREGVLPPSWMAIDTLNTLFPDAPIKHGFLRRDANAWSQWGRDWLAQQHRATTQAAESP